MKVVFHNYTFYPSIIFFSSFIFLKGIPFSFFIECNLIRKSSRSSGSRKLSA